MGFTKIGAGSSLGTGISSSYAPTFTGFGTPSAVSANYVQLGKILFLSITFTSGTATGVEARISLPAGSTAIAGPTLRVVGNGFNNVPGPSGSARNIVPMIETSGTYLTFGIEREATTVVALAKVLGTDMAANGTVLSFTATVMLA